MAYYTSTISEGSDACATPFAAGKQVLVLPCLLSKEECMLLRKAVDRSICTTAKSGPRKWLTSKPNRAPRGKTRVPVDTLGPSACGVADALLARR